MRSAFRSIAVVRTSQTALVTVAAFIAAAVLLLLAAPACAQVGPPGPITVQQGSISAILNCDIVGGAAVGGMADTIDTLFNVSLDGPFQVISTATGWMSKLFFTFMVAWFILTTLREGNPQETFQHMLGRPLTRIIMMGAMFGVINWMTGQAGHSAFDTIATRAVASFEHTGANAGGALANQNLAVSVGTADVAPGSGIVGSIGLNAALDNGKLGTIAKAGYCLGVAVIFGGSTGNWVQDLQARLAGVVATAIGGLASAAAPPLLIFFAIKVLCQFFFAVWVGGVIARVAFECIILWFYKTFVVVFGVILLPFGLLDIPQAKALFDSYWGMIRSVSLRIFIFSLGAPLFIGQFVILVCIMTSSPSYLTAGVPSPTDLVMAFFSSVIALFFTLNYAAFAHDLSSGSARVDGKEIGSSIGAAMGATMGKTMATAAAALSAAASASMIAGGGGAGAAAGSISKGSEAAASIPAGAAEAVAPPPSGGGGGGGGGSANGGKVVQPPERDPVAPG